MKRFSQAQWPTFVLFLIQSLLFSQLGRAYDQNKLNALISQLERPSMDQVVEMLDGNWTQHPFNFDSGLINNYKNLLPGLIASLEKAYPGATFVGMGRDSALLVNALDAFYKAHGQKGRALHLWASGGTIRGATPQQLRKSLYQLGLDLPHYSERPPFVLFDATNFNGGSQSNRVLRAIYEEVGHQGLPLQDVARKINLVNTYYGMYSQNLVGSDYDFDSYFRNLQVASNYGPYSILSFDTSSLMYGHEWSQTYGSFQDLPDGTVQALPMGHNDTSSKYWVLGDMTEVLKVVTSEAFYQDVVQAAAQRNYDFASVLALRDHNYQPPPPKTLEEKLVELHLEKLPEEREYHKSNGLKLTENGHKVHTFILRNSSLLNNEDELLLVLKFMAGAERNDLLGERDFIRILGFIMNEIPLTAKQIELLTEHKAQAKHLYKKLWEKISDPEEDETELYKENNHKLAETLFSGCALSMHRD